MRSSVGLVASDARPAACHGEPGHGIGKRGMAGRLQGAVFTRIVTQREERLKSEENIPRGRNFVSKNLEMELLWLVRDLVVYQGQDVEE